MTSSNTINCVVSIDSWAKSQLQRGQRETKFSCCCGKLSNKGTGYFCFVHNKQTPNNREASHPTSKEVDIRSKRTL